MAIDEMDVKNYTVFCNKDRDKLFDEKKEIFVTNFRSFDWHLVELARYLLNLKLKQFHLHIDDDDDDDEVWKESVVFYD